MKTRHQEKFQYFLHSAIFPKMQCHTYRILLPWRYQIYQTTAILSKNTTKKAFPQKHRVFNKLFVNNQRHVNNIEVKNFWGCANQLICISILEYNMSSINTVQSNPRFLEVEISLMAIVPPLHSAVVAY